VVTIPAQFNGPPGSGNGGYVAGMLAAELGTDGPVTSVLRTPPPLDVPLSWEHDGADLRMLTAGGAVVGHASPGTFEREAPGCPTAEQAEAGLAAYPGFHQHPFDTCFTCGTQRDEGDGLRLFTGPIAPSRLGAGVVAAPWAPHAAFGEPDGTIGTPVMWAALDCPGGWAADFTRRTMVLGTMTAEVTRRPAAGEPCRAVARLVAERGRKFLTDTALYTDDGDLLGRAEQVWIELPPR
jgi:hypothetical protein